MSQLIIELGDITQQSVDAIVCPAHKFLSRGQGLSGQVFDKAGEELVLRCQELSDCSVGEARITSGYKLPAKYILHTVTPMWTGGDQWGGIELKQLRDCYKSVLTLALKHQIKTLAIPALGAGSNKTPHPLSAHIGLEEILPYIKQFESVTICLHSEAALECWQKQYRDLSQAA